MKIIINERQLKKIVNKTIDREIDEQDLAGGETKTTGGQSGASTNIKNVTSKGTTSTQPKVTTWSDVVGSKLTRGVANKIDNTPRPDLVKRDGPDNQLI